MASLFLLCALCRLAQGSHLVWPGLGGSLQSRHLVGPPRAIFSSRAVARARSFTCLALAFRLASYFLRDTRWVSAQTSHLVCPSMAGSPHCRQRPRDLALWRLSCCRVRRFSCLAFGVSGILFAAGFSGGGGFLVLFIFDGAFFFPAGWGSWKVSTNSCLLGWCIPAPAGEPYPPLPPFQPTPVYPRACGGTSEGPPFRKNVLGLSPRLRGNLVLFPGQATHLGSIPAPAGEPGSQRLHTGIPVVYPRACGGTNNRRLLVRSRLGLSPRLRGNHEVVDGAVDSSGSIPAPAGEPTAEHFERE